MNTANPAMNEAVYGRAGYAESKVNAMTLGGTVLKTSLLLAILVVAAGFTWGKVASGDAGDMQLAYGLLIGGAIGGFIMAFVTIFIPKASPYTAPIYAALEGLFLGAISAVINAQYPGIALQAMCLTVGVLAVMLFLYGTGIMRATEKFKIGVIAATGAICLVYLVGMVMSFFGGHMPFIHDSGPIGIGFSGGRGHCGAQPGSGLRLHRAGSHTAGPEIHGMVRRLQLAGDPDMDVPGNPAAAGEDAE